MFRDTSIALLSGGLRSSKETEGETLTIAVLPLRATIERLQLSQCQVGNVLSNVREVWVVWELEGCSVGKSGVYTTDVQQAQYPRISPVLCSRRATQQRIHPIPELAIPC